MGDTELALCAAGEGGPVTAEGAVGDWVRPAAEKAHPGATMWRGHWTPE